MEYHEIPNDIKVQMFDFDTHFNSLESALGQLKKNMYVKINETISRLKKDLYEIRNNLRHRLLVQQLKINKNSFDINQSISDIKHLHRSNEVCEVSAFKSKIAKIRKLPPKLTICLRPLSRPIYLLNEFWERFNEFLDSFITSDVLGYLRETQEAKELPSKLFLDEPLVIKTITTD